MLLKEILICPDDEYSETSGTHSIATVKATEYVRLHAIVHHKQLAEF